MLLKCTVISLLLLNFLLLRVLPVLTSTYFSGVTPVCKYTPFLGLSIERYHLVSSIYFIYASLGIFLYSPWFSKLSRKVLLRCLNYWCYLIFIIILFFIFGTNLLFSNRHCFWEGTFIAALILWIFSIFQFFFTLLCLACQRDEKVKEFNVEEPLLV